MTSIPQAALHSRPAIWRDVRVLRVVAQIAVIVVIYAVGERLVYNVATGLAARNVRSGLDFLGQTAGFPIGEGLTYEATDSYGYAFWVGIVNTLRVIVLAIPLATLLATLIGASRCLVGDANEQPVGGHLEPDLHFWPA